MPITVTCTDLEVRNRIHVKVTCNEAILLLNLPEGQQLELSGRNRWIKLFSEDGNLRFNYHHGQPGGYGYNIIEAAELINELRAQLARPIHRL
jgi:hypothetical protein